MSRVIKFILAVLAVLAVVAFIVFYMNINSIVKSNIEEIGSQMTGTAVTVDRVAISPFTGKGQISGFRVANPDDFGREFAVEVEDFSIEMKLLSLFSDEILVHELVLTTPSIYVEQQLPANNIHIILRNIRNVEPGQFADSDLVIERFLMTDGTVDLYTELGGERSARVEISSVELADLGRGGERRAAEEIVMIIAEHVAEEALKGAARSGGEQIRDAIRDLFN